MIFIINNFVNSPVDKLVIINMKIQANIVLININMQNVTAKKIIVIYILECCN